MITLLHTARTTLTLLTEADLPAMEALAREPDTFKFIKKLRVMNPEQYTQFLHTKLEQIRTGVGYHWAVWLGIGSSAVPARDYPAPAMDSPIPATVSPDPANASSRLFIGAVNLNPIKGVGASTQGVRERGSSEGQTLAAYHGPARLQIGCQLKRDYWGQGFASELTARILHFAIHELRLPAVYGVFEQDNAISRRLLEKLGFVFEESFQEQEIITEIHKYVPPPPSADPRQAN
jgi:RimJ/RimL family protein N-acetyltransferase